MIVLSGLDDSERGRTVASDLPSVLVSLALSSKRSGAWIPDRSRVQIFRVLLQTWGARINTPVSCTSCRKAFKGSGGYAERSLAIQPTHLCVQQPMKSA